MTHFSAAVSLEGPAPGDWSISAAGVVAIFADPDMTVLMFVCLELVCDLVRKIRAMPGALVRMYAARYLLLL